METGGIKPRSGAKFWLEGMTKIARESWRANKKKGD